MRLSLRHPHTHTPTHPNTQTLPPPTPLPLSLSLPFLALRLHLFPLYLFRLSLQSFFSPPPTNPKTIAHRGLSTLLVLLTSPGCPLTPFAALPRSFGPLFYPRSFDQASQPLVPISNFSLRGCATRSIHCYQLALASATVDTPASSCHPTPLATTPLDPDVTARRSFVPACHAPLVFPSCFAYPHRSLTTRDDNAEAV